jgi:hypothetical protein
MGAEMFGELINSGITVAIGIYATGLGYRWFGPKPGESEKHDRWHAAWGTTFKYLGPFLIATAVILGVVGFLRWSARP